MTEKREEKIFLLDNLCIRSLSLRLKLLLPCGILHQEEQNTDSRIEQACSWFRGPLFPNSILTIIFHPIHGLLMETELVLLAQPTIYCCEISLHRLHSLDVRDNVLGPWLQIVSHFLKTHKNCKTFMVHCYIFLKAHFWISKCSKKRQDLSNAMGSMYAAVLFLGVQNASSVQPVVAIERTVFYRERAAGMYSALPYAFAQVSWFTKLTPAPTPL